LRDHAGAVLRPARNESAEPGMLTLLPWRCVVGALRSVIFDWRLNMNLKKFEAQASFVKKLESFINKHGWEIDSDIIFGVEDIIRNKITMTIYEKDNDKEDHE
jgi:hypothetical protein